MYEFVKWHMGMRTISRLLFVFVRESLGLYVWALFDVVSPRLSREDSDELKCIYIHICVHIYSYLCETMSYAKLMFSEYLNRNELQFKQDSFKFLGFMYFYLNLNHFSLNCNIMSSDMIQFFEFRYTLNVLAQNEMRY